jgi:hypothetical protein
MRHIKILKAVTHLVELKIALHSHNCVVPSIVQHIHPIFSKSKVTNFK